MAVALLGFVVTVLANTAIQGMGYEGDAVRKARASLIADQELWQLEAGLKLGVPPPLGRTDRDEGDEYHVAVEVQPLDAAALGFAAVAPAEPAAAGAAPAGAIGLLQIFVRVSWIEGLQEHDVTRTTFGYDASAAAEALASGEEQRPAPEQEPEPEEEP